MQRDEHEAYHRNEATRIADELLGLGPEFAEDGVVRTVLRERVVQEGQYAEIISLGGECYCLYFTPVFGYERKKK